MVDISQRWGNEANMLTTLSAFTIIGSNDETVQRCSMLDRLTGLRILVNAVRSPPDTCSLPTCTCMHPSRLFNPCIPTPDTTPIWWSSYPFTTDLSALICLHPSSIPPQHSVSHSSHSWCWVSHWSCWHIGCLVSGLCLEPVSSHFLFTVWHDVHISSCFVSTTETTWAGQPQWVHQSCNHQCNEFWMTEWWVYCGVVCVSNVNYASTIIVEGHLGRVMDLSHPVEWSLEQ